MAICYPDNAIWPDPSVLPVEPDAPVDPDNLTPEEEAAAAAYALAEQQVDIALGLGWTTLQVLSAYQIAICPIEVRPCRKSCAVGMSYYIAPAQRGDGPGYAPFWPNVRNGQWTNLWCGHRDDCACTTVQEVILSGPVGAIESVEIDGVALDPSAYRVDDGNKLVRQDGGSWPYCQDMNLPSGEVGTFVVIYYHGATADLLVRYAAGVLASEYLKGMLGEDCRLPIGTTNIIRQGITIEVEKGWFENGVTNIPEVDGVIARYNPFRAKLPARVFSPDTPKPREITVQGS